MKNLIYGTVRECTDKLFELIDFKKMIFPDFDFAACVDDDAESPEEAWNSAEGWFGVKDLGRAFDADTISLMFAHYGGGGIKSLELIYSEPSVKKEFVQKITESTDEVGWTLEPDSYTVFEILERKE